MSLVSNLSNLATRVATEIKTVRTLVNGNQPTNVALLTMAKGNLVAAINELKSGLDALASGAAGIDDDNISASTTYSSQKVVDDLASLKAEILGGAAGAWDTLQELKDFIDQNTGDLSALLTAVGNRIRFDAAQTLTDPQKNQALANMGAQKASDIGNTETNFVTTFEAGLA